MSLASGNVNRGLVMNVWAEAHLLLTPGSVNRRPVVNVYPGAHLSPASVLIGVLWYLMILSCNSLTVYDVEHVFL